MAPTLMTAPAPRGALHLIEEKVFTQIKEEGEAVNNSRWVVDIRATNHMMGARSTFSDLNTGVCDTIKLVDGSSRVVAPSSSTA
jgi:hypothetical protein